MKLSRGPNRLMGLEYSIRNSLATPKLTEKAKPRRERILFAFTTLYTKFPVSKGLDDVFSEGHVFREVLGYNACSIRGQSYATRSRLGARGVEKKKDGAKCYPPRPVRQ